MTEPTPNTPPAGGETPPPDGGNETPPAVTAEDVARLQAALDKERDLHKQAKQQLSQLTQAQRAAMDEGERKILEAREQAAAEVRTQYGTRLAQTEFRAAAAARNPGYDVGKALKYVNLSGLLGEDGEPDGKAIAAAVADLVPEGSTGPTPPPSFDGGTRQAAPGGADFNQMLRQAAGRA